jgi:hypothetical protein
MKHLARDHHDVTNAVTSVWCDKGFQRNDVTEVAGECSCEACLREASEYGALATLRLVNIRYARKHGVEL